VGWDAARVLGLFTPLLLAVGSESVREMTKSQFVEAGVALALLLIIPGDTLSGIFFTRPPERRSLDVSLHACFSFGLPFASAAGESAAPCACFGIRVRRNIYGDGLRPLDAERFAASAVNSFPCVMPG